MNVSILSVGDELLKGATLNTNLVSIGAELMSVGIMPREALTVKDEIAELRRALDYLYASADAVIVSGGLGPTADDVTKNVIADYFGLPLKQHPLALESVLSYWRKRRPGEEAPPRVLEQALAPEGADIIPNRVGTASGMIVEGGASHAETTRAAIMLPGPPHELNPMLADGVIPFLRKRIKVPLHSKTLRLGGVPESEAERRVIAAIGDCPGLSIAYCASPEVLRVFLLSADRDLVDSQYEELSRLFGSDVLREGNDLSEDVVCWFQRQGWTLATAESCTGGMIAAAITDVPGSSKIFEGGIVSYNNEVKKGLLDVSEDTLSKYGAVSEDCVREMLLGLRRQFTADAGIAVSGIAGPDGGTAEKPVGLVFIGVRIGDRIEIREHTFPGDRITVRRRAAASALTLLRSITNQLIR